MKKLFYLFPLLGMMVASCSSEEPSRGGLNNVDPQVNSYLSVNIVPTSGTGTRADDNVQGDGTYRDGDPEEQKVNSIRFFFFDKDGNGAPISKMVADAGAGDTYVSYIDWIHNDDDLGNGIPEETVEATLSATLGLSIPDGNVNPVSLIAVINPSSSVKALAGSADSPAGPDRATVLNEAADFQTNLTESNFVMSNSVYANTLASPAETVNTTSLEAPEGQPSYFQSSIEAAQANPVTIYVERVVARINLTIGLDFDNSLEVNGNTLYPVMKKVDSGEDMQTTITVDGVEKKVYVQFLGWNVTSTPDQSYLVKRINPSWTTTGLFGATSPIWNSMDYHRSFWAMNPALAENNYQYGNFNGNASSDNPQPANALPIPKNGQFSKAYMQENASIFSGDLTASAPLHPTQVIIAAQLVYDDGTPIELAEWGYKKYTQSDLLTYLVSNIISKGNFYKKTGPNSYESLQPGDLTFVSALQYYYPEALPENVERYFSYIVVKTTETPTEWYVKTGTGDEMTDANMTKTTDQAINEFILNSVGYTLMWNSGFTYYYFDIRHFGQTDSFAYNGVVRNHLYEANVKTLYGYGTPVCNPDEIIIPEAPEYEEILLAAEIKILQWRVVKADYDLDWR